MRLSFPSLKIRVSLLTYVIAGLMLLEIVLAVLALSLPWGKTSAGTDIRFALAGLLPWFGFIPVLLQAGFLAVDSRGLQTLYMVMDFLIGAFIILVHYLTYLKYSDFEFGFFLVFMLGAVVIVTGVVCMIERKVFGGLIERGKARTLPASTV